VSARPLLLIGGYLTGPRDFAALAAELARPPYGYRVFVAPIGRARWALTRDWDFRPVLDTVRASVEQALTATGADRLEIVGHSVGGTVARMYLGEQPYLGTVYGGRRYVRRLVMLGSPHHSQERWTRRSIGFVNGAYPGAFYDDVQYVSVIGRALRGDPRGSLVQRMAASSYRTVSGPEHARAWGDGITTLHCAALAGAEFLAVDGLFHSPLHGRPWYGDPAALPLWERVLGARAGATSDLPVVV
jgi:triacylglycerol esterase/lipase EstA (alpha/beta hydrolase family)